MTRWGLGLGLAAAACLVLLGSGVSPCATSAKPSGFLTYLKDSKLSAIYVVELERLCLEEGDLDACRQASAELDRAGNYDVAIGLADALEGRPADLGQTAMLIKARSLAGAARYRRAIGVLDSIVSSFPPNDAMVEADLLRCQCALDLGESDRALVNLRDLDPRIGSDRRAAYLALRARAEEQRGDRARACEIYTEGWKKGLAEAAAGLARCHLRAGRVDPCLALFKDVSKKGLTLPVPDACGLADLFGGLKPAVSLAALGSVLADTAFNTETCPRAAPTLIGLAEAGENVSQYCEVLEGRAGSAGAKQQLRYAGALSLKDSARAADALRGLIREDAEPRLRIRCLGAAMALDPVGRAAMARDLGSDLRVLAAVLQPSDRLEFARALVDCGVEDAALAELGTLRQGLKAGEDDAALVEIALLAERAGDRETALALYDEVAASPVLSRASLSAEREAVALRALAGPEADLATEVDKVVKKGASDLELGDLFMTKLKDYARAAGYYRSAAASSEGADADRVRLKLAQALALAGLKAADDTGRAEALNILALLAESKAVKPDEVLAATKMATGWLELDKPKVIEIAAGIAARKDASPAMLYQVAALLSYLYTPGDQQVYERSAAILTRLTTDGPTPKQAPFAGLALARLKFAAGDFGGAIDAFEAYAAKTKDPIGASLASRGLGECYLASGGIQAATDYLSKSRAPEALFELGWALELLGRPDSSAACYRAVLAGLVPAALADRARLRLALVVGAGQGLGEALDALDSPLVEVRRRLGPARNLVRADRLAAEGYDVIGIAGLQAVASADPTVAGEALLAAARHASLVDPAAAGALVAGAAPDPAWPLDEYQIAAARARYACSDSEPGACTEARQQVIRRFPLDRDLVAELGARRALAALERAPAAAAEATADSLLASAPAHPLLAEVLYREGVARMVGGDYPAAAKLFLKITEAYPASPTYRDACFKLGSAYYMMKEFEPSALYFGLAVLSDKPSLVKDALFNYSLALEQTGEFRKAAEACRRLAVDFPYCDQFERALVRAGYCFQSAGSPAEAIASYDGALRYSGDDETLAETRYWIAEAFAQLGDHVRAACEFLRTAYLHPKQAQWAGTAAFTAGDECEKAGLIDLAILIYKQNVRKYGKTSEWGKASEERLAELERPSKAPGSGGAPGGK